jgi:hypothetical protein
MRLSDCHGSYVVAFVTFEFMSPLEQATSSTPAASQSILAFSGERTRERSDT